MTHSRFGYSIQPIPFLLVLILLVIVAFFAEIQGLFHAHVKTLYKRQLFVLELIFIIIFAFDRQLKYPNIKDIPRFFLFVAVFWIVWGFLSALQAMQPFLALFTYTEHLILILFGYAVYTLIQSYKNFRETLLWMILFGFAAYCIFFGLSYFIVETHNPKILFSAQFEDVGFRNVRHFGYYLAIGLVVATGVGGHPSSKKYNYLWWFCVMLSVIAWSLIFWAGGRGPVVAFFVSLMLMIFLLGGLRNSAGLIWFVAGTCVAGMLLSLVIPGGYGVDYMLGKLFWLPEEASVMFDVKETPSKRIEMWLSCLGDIKTNPLFGIGQSNFIYGCGKEFHPILHPHGIHIQAALDWGVPGALAFFLLGGVVVVQTFSPVKTKQNCERQFFTPIWGLLMLLVASAYDGIFFHRYSLMFFMLFFVMTIPDKKVMTGVKVGGDGGRSIYYGVLFLVFGLLYYLAINGYQFIVEYEEIF